MKIKKTDIEMRAEDLKHYGVELTTRNYMLYVHPKTFHNILVYRRRSPISAERWFKVGEWYAPGLSSDGRAEVPMAFVRDVAVALHKLNRVEETLGQHRVRGGEAVRAWVAPVARNVIVRDAPQGNNIEPGGQGALGGIYTALAQQAVGNLNQAAQVYTQVDANLFRDALHDLRAAEPMEPPNPER